MRPLLILLLAALPGCPTTQGEDLPGQLVLVTVETVQDSCEPPRAEGDGGVQWAAARPDGGVVFTVLDQVKYGPLRDGGVLEGLSREQVPPLDGGRTELGAGDGCRALIAGWSIIDGGLELSQQWPGVDVCPAAPGYAPRASCAVVRRLWFTPLRDCPERCVRLSAGGASCDC
jgi:hypothetical protein